MKSLFITVRFDRMKNSDLNAIYQQLLSIPNFKKITVPDLIAAINRLEEHKPLTKVLATKPRKQLHTAEITKLRIATDKLVAAMQFHIKALNLAQFDEDTNALLNEKDTLTKLFKNYNKKIITDKALIHYTLNSHLKYRSNFSNNLTELGLMRFVDKLNEIDAKINRFVQLQKEAQKKQPAPNTTQPTKEKLIGEIRFYLRTIEMYLLTHPEAVENELIDLTNFYLKVARTQLRNTTTRRLRRKEKEDKERMSDETEVSEI
ncbi:MAG: hypothetical protein WCG93_02190 [Paludibacter sp.]